MPTSDVTEAMTFCRSMSSATYARKNGLRHPVPDDARDLDLMHREDHGRGRAVLGERLAHRGQRDHPAAETAEALRDEGAHEVALLERRDGLLGESPLPVDRVGRGSRDLGSDASHGIDVCCVCLVHAICSDLS